MSDSTATGDFPDVYRSLHDYEALRASYDALRAERDALRNALVMARERLPELDSLPRTPTRIREIVESVEAALAARGKDE